MSRCFTLLLAGVSIVTILQPSGARAESLRDAVQNALGQHPSVEAARAGEDYTNEERRETKADLFPTLRTSASGGRMYGDNSTSRGLTVNRGQAYSWLWEGNATLTQPLFNGLETYNRIDAAQARQESAQMNVSDVRETLALRAVQAYIAVLQTTEAVQKINDYKSKIADYQSRIQVMVDQGAADEAEVAQAKNVSLLLDNTLADTKAQLDTAYAAYKEAVGRLPESALTRPDAPGAMIAATPEEALTNAKSNHPTILAAYKQMEAAGYDVDAERGTLLPTLDGELSYLKRDQVEELGGELEDGRALLRMSWDFSLGGGDLARIRKTKAAYSEKLAQSQEKIIEVERDIRLSYADLERSKKQKTLSAERVQILQDLFDANESQFEGARVRLLQLMQSDNQLFGAKLESLNADYAHLMAQYAALASAGRLQSALMLNDGFSAKAQPAVVPVVAAPKMETKIQADPEPPIREIDDRAIHKGLLKEKSAPQKAAIIEEEFPQEEIAVETVPPVMDEPAVVPVKAVPASYEDERVYPDLSE